MGSLFHEKLSYWNDMHWEGFAVFSSGLVCEGRRSQPCS